MTGIGMSGVGIGTIIIPLIMASFINSYGWRTSYVIVGFITLLSIAGIAQFLRREPSITKSIPQDGELIGTDIIGVMADRLSCRQAIQTRPFWLICVMLFSFGFALQVIMVHIVPHAIDLGIPETTATSIMATIGGIGIAGRVVMGSVSDRIGNKSALNICFALLSVALFWLLFNNEL